MEVRAGFLFSNIVIEKNHGENKSWVTFLLLICNLSLKFLHLLHISDIKLGTPIVYHSAR